MSGLTKTTHLFRKDGIKMKTVYYMDSSEFEERYKYFNQNDKEHVEYCLGKGHRRYFISYNSEEELDRKLEEAMRCVDSEKEREKSYCKRIVEAYESFIENHGAKRLDEVWKEFKKEHGGERIIVMPDAWGVINPPRVDYENAKKRLAELEEEGVKVYV
jgi:hypothetical protein